MSKEKKDNALVLQIIGSLLIIVLELVFALKYDNDLITWAMAMVLLLYNFVFIAKSHRDGKLEKNLMG